MINLFKKSPYKITVKKESVYCKWLKKDITTWAPTELDSYKRELRESVQRTVSKETWKLLNEDEQRTEDSKYQNYVEDAQNELIQKFKLQKEKVKIGHYHGDTLVISLEVEDAKVYPYYFMGIQLKPYRKQKKSRTKGST